MGYLYERREPGENYLEFAKRIRNRNIREGYQELVEALYQEIYGQKSAKYGKREAFYDALFEEVKEIKGGYFYFTRKHFL